MTTPPYDAADRIEGPPRSALIDLLYRLADDDLVIGHRNSEWTGLAPILEADIAFSSIAQDQVGQAVAYYNLLHELGEPEPDLLAFGRPVERYRCCSLVALDKGDWAFSTVRLFLYDTAKSHRVNALATSAYVPLAQLAGKVRGEQKYHLMHANLWIEKLGRATERSQALMQKSLEALMPHALGMFEPTSADEVLRREGIAPSETELRDQWLPQATEALTNAGLSVPRRVEPVYGGRSGRHPADLSRLVDALQKVYRLDPAATW